MTTAKLFRISAGFARRNNLPVYFVGVVTRDSGKAKKIFGRGTVETARMGSCCVCGRALTHPVSIELGIGPECGSHFWNWDLVGGFTPENVERLKTVVRSKIRVDSWIPRSCIVSESDTDETVEVPSDANPAPTSSTSTETTMPKRRAILDGDRIKIFFEFDRRDLDRIRSLPGRRFHGNADPKFWTAPVTREAIESLKEWGFDVASDLLSKIETVTLDDSKTRAPVVLRDLPGDLYPFQKEGVEFIHEKRGRAIVGDQMGLGKTVQALAWLAANPEIRPAIVVVPASLKLNWDREATKWLEGARIEVLSGTRPHGLSPRTDVFVINYDILDKWTDELRMVDPRALILDEAHFIKNRKAIRTRAVKKLAKGIPNVVALTGTPLENRPVEIYNVAELIRPGILGPFLSFGVRFCNGKKTPFGWDFSGASNVEDLHEILSSIMIRRKKADVLRELPDKVRAIVPMELRNAATYRRAEKDFIEYVRETRGNERAARAKRAEQLAKIEALKQLAVRGKIENAIQWVRDFLDSNGKLIAFASHKETIDALMTAFGDQAVKVDGSTSTDARQNAVDRFQTDPRVRLFVGNIRAAGVGLTLTAASDVAFLELPWTPGALDQAEDRAHRIGQKDVVNVYYLVAENTVEEKIATLLDSKRRVLDKVVDGIETDEGSLFASLMEELED